MSTQQRLVLCESCLEVLPANYATRRCHVYGRHAPNQADGAHGEQKALEVAMRQCFPEEQIVNDLVCNYPKCEIVIQLESGKKKQLEHVRETHVTKRYACPVNGQCSRTMRFCRVGDHLRDDHRRGVRMLADTLAANAADGKSEKERYVAMRSETKNEVERLLPICFPHHHADNHLHLTHRVPLPVGATNRGAMDVDGDGNVPSNGDSSSGVDDEEEGGPSNGHADIIDSTMDEGSQAECSASSSSSLRLSASLNVLESTGK